MSTLSQPHDPLPMPPVEYVNGQECITKTTLDNVWPPDDRTPLYGLSKGGTLPPTCVDLPPAAATLFTEAQIAFAFGAYQPPWPVSSVPLPAGGLLLATALVTVAIWRKMT